MLVKSFLIEGHLLKRLTLTLRNSNLMKPANRLVYLANVISLPDIVTLGNRNFNYFEMLLWNCL
jgi:hypothetical protein